MPSKRLLEDRRMLSQMRRLKLTIFLPQEQNPVTLSNDGPEDQILLAEQASSAANATSAASHSVNPNEMVQNNSTDSVLSETFTSTGPITSTSIAKASETALLDERSLLACIVRTIPASGRIRISSTVSELKCQPSNFSL